MISAKEFEQLKKIEEVAQVAYEHFAYLSGVGSLTREEDAAIEVLGEALKKL